MASELATSASVPSIEPLSPAERLSRLCVRRRVPITVALLALLLVLDGFVFHGQPRNILNWTDPLAAAGVLLIFFGLLVRSWAAGTLKKQRELATTGPYACVRHPLYFGSCLMMAGFAVLGFAPLSLAIVGPPLAYIYWQTIKSEERHIAKLFPLEWPAYAARTWRLIPRRLALPNLSEFSLAQWLKNSEYQAWLGAAGGLLALFLYQMLIRG